MEKLPGYLNTGFVEGIADLLPKRLRALAYGRALHLDKPLSKKIVFKLAQTKEELEACFRLLHDAYVSAGFMKPAPSGLRVTLYHALPTTSTLMCRYDDRVVGTVSLIRKSKLGFPMQRIFDLEGVRKEGGNMAEVSGLAIERHFDDADSQILIPLLKFMYEYAEYRFDTRHLVIAAHPRHLGFYENLFGFERLDQPLVEHYDFVDGMAAVGAHLNLAKGREFLREKYAHQRPDKNLYHYFVAAALPNSQFPHRRFHTTTDPVMTPELIDYFFNQRTQTFSSLSQREIMLLHTVYDLPEYKFCLPLLPDNPSREKLRSRSHRRFPVRCPGRLRLSQPESSNVGLTVYECSEAVFCAHFDSALTVGMSGEVDIDLGESWRCTLPVRVSRLGKHSNRVAMLNILDADSEQHQQWTKFVSVLNRGRVSEELDEATRLVSE
ncbi:MAG: hypothetical protein LBB76_00305 [Azoarcus sp.]|nr:hypothetical protein [Azoarcus sp.]